MTELTEMTPVFADLEGFLCFSTSMFLLIPIPAGFVGYWVGRMHGKKEGETLLQKALDFVRRRGSHGNVYTWSLLVPLFVVATAVEPIFAAGGSEMMLGFLCLGSVIVTATLA